MRVKSIIRRMIQAVGYTVQRYNPNAPSRDFFSEQKRLTDFEGSKRIIFDVGAHSGEVTATYRLLMPESTIFSFEPSPESFAALERRFEKDHCVHPVQAAISNGCGTRTFFSYQSKANNSLLKASRDAEDFVPGGLFDRQHEYEVKTVTIDSICKANGVENVSILKMDIQGGELLALQGARRMLQEARISLIYAEVWFVRLYEGQPLFHHLCCDLEDFGYCLYDIYSPVHRQGQVLWADAIFLGPTARRSWKNRVTSQKENVF